MTVVYSWTTWFSAQEMQRSRLEASQPVLHLAPEVLGVNYPIARLTNVGRGYARNIEAKLLVSIGGVPKWNYTWRMSLMAPGEHHDFLPAVSDTERQLTAPSIAEEGRRFSMQAAYEDPLGRRYQSAASADWKDLTEHLFGAQMLRKTEPIDEIAKQIERLSNAARSAVGFDGLKVITYAEQRLREEDLRRFIEEQREENLGGEVQ